jgi:hypothetical protein
MFYEHIHYFYNKRQLCWQKPVFIIKLDTPGLEDEMTSNSDPGLEDEMTSNSDELVRNRMTMLVVENGTHRLLLRLWLYYQPDYRSSNICRLHMHWNEVTKCVWVSERIVCDCTDRGELAHFFSLNF